MEKSGKLLPYDPAIPLLGIVRKEYKSGVSHLHTHVYDIIIHNS
jgi:hypothetical protein